MPKIFIVHGIISGNVQGIGYRWFVERTAVSLELKGWVRNLPDRNVEFSAEGEKNVLDGFLDSLKTGHPGAFVSV